jgi:hypothetical protein
MDHTNSIVIANGLPTTGKKSEGWNHRLITGD